MDEPVMLENCPICEGDLRTVFGPVDVRVGSRSATVDVEHQRCGACGEVFFTPEAADEAQRRASAAVRREEGLLQPEEVRSLRERLGLTQAQFENLLGVGPKTVVRWERGTVFQNGATDRLLRVLRAVPEAVTYLLRLGGTRVHRPAFELADVSDWRGQAQYHYVALSQPQQENAITPIEPYLNRATARRKVTDAYVETDAPVFKEAIG